MMTSSQKQLESCLEPVIFLDLFDYPLTAWEVFQYQEEKSTYLQVINNLEQLLRQGIVRERFGFYYLSGRDEIVTTRQQRYNYSRQKIKKALFFTKLFALFPGVLTVSAANFIGDHNWRHESDIDFFIISKSKQLWLTRLYCAGLAKLLFSRPRKGKKQDKICLSFYISEDALNLSHLQLVGGDPYFRYWLQGLYLLFDRNNTFSKFRQANGLIKNSQVPELKEGVEASKKTPSKMEVLAKKIQLKILPQELKQVSDSSGVVITDDILKLYSRERRPYFKEKFEIKKYEIFKKFN